jgi:hypothetical protein
MTDIPLNPAQEAAIAEALGLQPEDGPPTAAMLLVMFDVREIVVTEESRWLLGLVEGDPEPTDAMARIVREAYDIFHEEQARWPGQ